MSQQVGIALGTPVMSAVVTAFAAATLLPGLRVAIGANAALTLAAAILLALVLRRPETTTSAQAPAGAH
jgi:hypothetical protein